MAEYGSMFLVSGLAAILFFGGWHGPIPIAEPIAGVLSVIVEPLVNIGRYLLGFIFGDMGRVADGVVAVQIANLMGCLNFLLKGTIGVTVMMWVRWTLPRLRIDQVMTTCLKYCVPIAAFGFVGALFWQVFEVPTLNDLPRIGINRFEANESWVLQADQELRAAALTPSPSDVQGEPVEAVHHHDDQADRHRGHDVARGLPADESPRLQGHAGHRCYCVGWHARHPDPAVDHPGDLRDHHRD